MYAFCFRFCLLWSILESIKHSLRKAGSWYNSFFQKFRNGMLYYLAFTREAPIQKLQSVWVSIWGQCRGFEKNWMSPMVITKVWQFRSLTLIILIKKNPKNWICCWDSGHDWQQSQQVNQVYSQGHDWVWISYLVESVWRYLLFFYTR